jgi:hypothetical protein
MVKDSFMGSGGGADKRKGREGGRHTQGKTAGFVRILF